MRSPSSHQTEMARRGSSKRLSVEHEEFIARKYGGTRSKSSGGAAHDQGDVRCPTCLIECKASMKAPKKLIEEFEKITKEAYSEGKDPALALRYYAPDSILADADGWIDLIVRTVADDQALELRREELQESGDELKELVHELEGFRTSAEIRRDYERDRERSQRAGSGSSYS
jgi:hypothetical protein